MQQMAQTTQHCTSLPGAPASVIEHHRLCVCDYAVLLFSGQSVHSNVQHHGCGMSILPEYIASMHDMCYWQAVQWVSSQHVCTAPPAPAAAAAATDLVQASFL
jgi:hypothetical protein